MQQEHPSKWQLATRVNHPLENIFKLKAINQEEFIMHLPRNKVIKTFDNSLKNQDRTFVFSQEIQAIEYFDLNEAEIVAAGTKQGIIQIKNVLDDQTYKLQAPEVMPSSQRYINDMLYLGDGKLMNCYNNGAVAIWNLNGPLSNTLTPLSYKKVHSSFTYKLRRMDPETVLTCSNDRYAKLFDIETSSILGSFLHEDSIWCSYPLNQNLFCSAGLMNKIVFWDVRLKRIVNKCELEGEQTSFVTRFDQNNIIFGDSFDLCTCDLRKTSKMKLGSSRMKISAESILVTQDQIIAVGRGGDLCRFVNSQEDIQVVQTTMSENSNQALNMHRNLLEYILHLRNLAVFNHGAELIDDLDEDIDPQLLLEEGQPDQDQQLQLQEYPQLDNHQNEYLQMLEEQEASQQDLEQLPPEADEEIPQQQHAQQQRQEQKPSQLMDIERSAQDQNDQESKKEQQDSGMLKNNKPQSNRCEDKPQQ